MTKAASPQRIVVRCDANGIIGGGHAMRCLTLANALSEAGAKIAFVAATMPAALEKRIGYGGHQFHAISASPEMHRGSTEWEEPSLSAEAQLEDARSTGAAVGRADWAIVDHYLLDSRWHSAARAFADRILVIDDLANRPYDCEILLDQTFGRSANDYRKLVPSRARILAGATYALLRPEFARERSAALERRHAGGAVRRILISMGTADAGGITARILDRVLAAAPECAIDVILGFQATRLEHIQRLAARHSAISVHMDSDRMAEIMRDADIAIGAAGTTSWERCCLGLPSIAVVLAENQSLIADRLAAAGAHIAILIGNEQSLTAQVNTLLTCSEIRTRMAEIAAQIIDGLGSERVRAAMDALIASEIADD